MTGKPDAPTPPRRSSGLSSSSASTRRSEGENQPLTPAVSPLPRGGGARFTLAPPKRVEGGHAAMRRGRHPTHTDAQASHKRTRDETVSSLTPTLFAPCG
jgi:hypothetical protein